TEADALVRIPGSSYIWMAEPFSAVPTSFLVRSGARQWWSNCIWDGLAILALLCLDGTVSSACPSSGQPLLVTAADAALVNPRGVVHFVVPARDWWRDTGLPEPRCSSSGRKRTSRRGASAARLHGARPSISHACGASPRRGTTIASIRIGDAAQFSNVKRSSNPSGSAALSGA